VEQVKMRNCGQLLYCSTVLLIISKVKIQSAKLRSRCATKSFTLKIKDRFNMQYKDYLRNHVVLPGREKALEKFLKQTYEGMLHKKKNSFNSNSEDALTWSCFDILRNLPSNKMVGVLNEIWEDAYQAKIRSPFSDLHDDEIKIEIGKQYTGSKTKNSTEVDASIELPGVLVFFEAKLYSAVSVKTPKHKHDQIARKLRIGLDNPLNEEYYDFYFIFLDIAPRDKLMCRKSKKEALAPAKGFHDKWKSAWLFSYYKYGRNNSLKPLREILKDIPVKDIKQVSTNMGWLTWADLFKDLLRGMI
jgi:hypothetical protein